MTARPFGQMVVAAGYRPGEDVWRDVSSEVGDGQQGILEVKHELHLCSEPGASAELRDRIGDAIDRWNMEVTGDRDYRPVTILLRDDDGTIHGGVTGGVWGTWLHVTGLWVDEAFRGLGFGRGLLLAAEAEARKAGARHAFLETHTFQAPGLYQRLGYSVIAELEDYPPGDSQLIMRKELL